MKENKIKEELEMDNKLMVIGTLIGFAVGVSAGLLFAPQSGKETRKQIKEKVVEIKNKAGQVIGVIQEKYAHNLDLDEIKGFK
jgi:gas vesicle protein